MLTVPARLLGDAERQAVEKLLDADPYAGAQVAERIGAAGLTPARQDARVFGYGSHQHLEALCWLGSNLIPVHSNRAAASAFADLAATQPRTCSSLVGSANGVLEMWSQLSTSWGPAREIRACQPLLATATAGSVTPDPGVRLVRPNEIDILFPAAVAMYTEEVGVSPLVGGGGHDYRRRLVELVRSRRAYAKIIGGQVVFKAELAVVTRHTAQVQGVWVSPDRRGRGVATAAMAAVVTDALRRIAPTVSLYVNDYNAVARRVYGRCGFRQVGTFATVLL